MPELLSAVVMITPNRVEALALAGMRAGGASSPIGRPVAVA